MEHKVCHYVGLGDLPMEMWLEIIRHASWRIAWSLVLSCKYSYMTLARYLQHPQIQLNRFADYCLPYAAILIKNGRIYYHSLTQRRDRTFNSIAEMRQFTADLQMVENSSYQFLVPVNPTDAGIYRCIISDNGYERLCYNKDPAKRVFGFVMNFIDWIDHAIPQKDPGVVIISIGELSDRKKSCPFYIKRRRTYRFSFRVRFVLDAQGNLEWSAPGGYNFRTIYAKQLYDDLKEAITSDRAHLKPLEIPTFQTTEYGRSYCAAFFKAKFVDKSGIKHKLHRVILHEDNKRAGDSQNYKEKTFKTILKHMDRVLDKRDVRTKPWLTALCYAKGRQTLPWHQLFRPPADLQYDTLNFMHCWK